MTNFFDLFISHSSRPEFRDDPTWADRRFPEVISTSPFRLWQPGDPIIATGERLLIGVATWSGYDMRLLDVIAEALSRNPINPPVIDVFNTAKCKHMKDFAVYIPGLSEAMQIPVIGFWRDQQFYAFEQGHAARERVARLFGSNSDEIVAFVQEWINTRQCAQ